MPQHAATIESLPMAFEMVKEMQADGLEWGEDYRPLGRQALAEIIQGRMAEAVDRWLDSLDGPLPESAGCGVVRRRSACPDSPSPLRAVSRVASRFMCQGGRDGVSRTF